MRRDLKRLLFAIAGAAIFGVASARAADCGDSADGFDDWLASFKQVAIRDGVSPQVVDAALNGVVYRSVRRGARSRPGIRAEFRRFRGAPPYSEPDQEGQDDAPCLCRTVPENRTALWRSRAGPGRDLGARDRLWRRPGRLSDLQRARDARLRLPAGANLPRRAHRCPDDRPARAVCGRDRCAAPGRARSAKPSSCRRPISNTPSTSRAAAAATLLSPADALASTANFLRGHGLGAGRGLGRRPAELRRPARMELGPGLRQDDRAFRGQTGWAGVGSACRARPRSTCQGPTIPSENLNLC